MKKTAFFAPLLFLILSACGGNKEEAKEFVPPVIESFVLQPNGDVILSGKGMNALKDVDEDYNFSISMHSSLGESSFIAFGKNAEIKDDETAIFKPSQLSKAELYIRNKAISDSLRAIITPEWGGKEQTLEIPKAKYAAVIGYLGAGNKNYTLWIDMKDTGKAFYDPNDKSTTFTIFGHYELYSYQKGNNSEYNRKKLNYVSRASLEAQQ